ncbi:hypothetical protein CCAN11_2480047 [Capnocytophaga canimorsus]|uniref:Uncharacterized protein n=1 Tax=Capnocytophaga canimorsus TaxID=28188 RepID=A0A0B7IL48_9FLAO|nr:hypothetical protein CCAN11_2480047 [Capnocytophaga canimorsus]
MRSMLVPVVSITSNMSTFVIMAGLGLAFVSKLGIYVAIIGVVMMGLATLFSFVTLPVEYDASNRALAWLKNKNMVTPRRIYRRSRRSEMGSTYISGSRIRSFGYAHLLGITHCIIFKRIKEYIYKNKKVDFHWNFRLFIF